MLHFQALDIYLREERLKFQSQGDLKYWRYLLVTKIEVLISSIGGLQILEDVYFTPKLRLGFKPRKASNLGGHYFTLKVQLPLQAFESFKFWKHLLEQGRDFNFKLQTTSNFFRLLLSIKIKAYISSLERLFLSKGKASISSFWRLRILELRIWFQALEDIFLSKKNVSISSIWRLWILELRLRFKTLEDVFLSKRSASISSLKDFKFWS